RALCLPFSSIGQDVPYRAPEVKKWRRVRYHKFWCGDPFAGLNFAFERIYFAAPKPFHANLRVRLRQVRSTFRCFSVDAGRAISRVSEGILPAAEVGARQGETTARHRRRNHLQRIWVLQHRLPEQLL